MGGSIAESHTVCVDLFAALLSVIKQHPTSHPLLETDVQDEFDKYSMWAGNVGAAFSGQNYRRSLDYRLREASFYKEQVCKSSYISDFSLSTVSSRINSVLFVFATFQVE